MIFTTSPERLVRFALDVADKTTGTGRHWPGTAIEFLANRELAERIDSGIRRIDCEYEVATKAARDTIAKAYAVHNKAMQALTEEVAAILKEGQG